MKVQSAELVVVTWLYNPAQCLAMGITKVSGSTVPQAVTKGRAEGGNPTPQPCIAFGQ